MVVRFRKKVVKKRGSRTYGYGSSKKHRGKGSKGGKGLAGSGKKGQQKKILLKSLGYEIGKSGFRTPYKGKIESITTRQILENLLEIGKEYGINTIDTTNKKIVVDIEEEIKIVHQPSFEGLRLDDEYREYDVEIKLLKGKITDKAKQYLEDNGIAVIVESEDKE